MQDQSLERTAEYWSVHGIEKARRAHWEAHPVVQSVFTERRQGLGAIEGAARMIGATGGRGLGLGVGAASGELELLRLGTVTSLDLYDVTPALIAAAEQAAAAQGVSSRVRCFVTDVNRLEIPADTYDLITFFSSLHHVEQVEHVLEQCRRALRPGGVFYANEYVGPSRFAFPAEHVDLARRFYRTIRPELTNGLPELAVPDPLAVAAADPTESIRSEEIVAACRRAFPATHIVSRDVCLTIILWYGLNYETVYDTAAGHDLVHSLLEIDRALVQSGRLPTYYAEILARV